MLHITAFASLEEFDYGQPSGAELTTIIIVIVIMIYFYYCIILI